MGAAVIIDSLEIHDQILDKIERRHGIRFDEVEEACFTDHRHVRRTGGGLYKVFSRTDAGRYLLVVLVPLHEDHWRVVTAREMTSNERRLYRAQRGLR